MLKKHGQLCQHSIPDYSGHLTDSEFETYNSVFASIESDFKELAGITNGLAGLEKSLPQLLEKVSAPSRQAVGGEEGSEWEVIAPLDKQHGEILWCKRQLGDMEEFAVVERFDPNSPLAAAQGEFDVEMTDTDPMRLLRDFINARRETAQLFANDIVATAQEQATEKYPGEDLGRVLEAIAQRCTKAVSPEQTNSPAHARRQSEGMHI